MFRLMICAALFTLSAPAMAGDVSLTTNDGVSLHAEYFGAEGADRGVVFVHMAGRQAADWRFLAEKVNRAGFHTIAVDLRGHGQNLSEGETVELTEDDWAHMTRDVTAAVGYLRDQGVSSIALVGASLGANLSALVAAEDPGIGNLILLSPGIKYKGVPAGDALQAYDPRPVLMVVSDDDRYSAKSALVFEGSLSGDYKLEILSSAGHGTRMLNTAPSLEPLIQSWLMETQTIAEGEGGVLAPSQTGDTTEVESEGEKLEYHQ